MVLEAAASVAVDFTEVVLADSEAMELAASAVALVQVEVISAVMALVVLTAVKVRIFMRRLLSALMKLLLAVRRLSACRAATVASRITKSIFRQVLNPVNLSDLKEKDIRESAEVLTGMGSHYRPSGSAENWHAQIAITRGCNRFCSYCIVPYVRGREVSREPADVLAEARELVASGAREILLLGQNVAAYGLGGNINPPAADNSPFADLLEELDRIPELLRVRFTSPYPTYFNDRLIGVMASSRTVCRNIHLPLQSGSDRVLREMNRQYTAAGYLEVVEKIRNAMPGVTFSTDVIVGFPGETDEDFAMTRDLMNRVGFDNSFIFKYSPRPGAKSASLADSVPQEVKEERNRILLEDLHRRVESALKGAVGSVQEVLVEGVSPRNPERWCGRTGTNRMIHFLPDAATVPGTLRQVRIERAGSVSLYGTLL